MFVWNVLPLSICFGMRLALAFLPRRLPKGSDGSKAPMLSIISFCLTLPEKGKSDDYLVPRDEGSWLEICLSPFFSKIQLSRGALTILRPLEWVGASVGPLFVVFAALVLHVLIVLSFLDLLIELPYKVLLHVEKFLGYLLLILAQVVYHYEDFPYAFELPANAFVLLFKWLALVLFEDVGLEGLLFLK